MGRGDVWQFEAGTGRVIGKMSASDYLDYRFGPNRIPDALSNHYNAAARKAGFEPVKFQRSNNKPNPDDLRSSDPTQEWLGGSGNFATYAPVLRNTPFYKSLEEKVKNHVPSIDEELAALKAMLAKEGVLNVVKQYPQYATGIYNFNTLLTDPSKLVGTSGSPQVKGFVGASGNRADQYDIARFSGQNNEASMPPPFFLPEQNQKASYPDWGPAPFENYKTHLSKKSQIDKRFEAANKNKWNLKHGGHVRPPHFI